MGIQLSHCVENIVGKGEIAFSFPTRISKNCLLLMFQNEYLCSEGFKENFNSEYTVISYDQIKPYLTLSQTSPGFYVSAVQVL